MTTATLTAAATRTPAAPAPLSAADLVAYYSEAGPDFAAWSPGFNMHFGFHGRGIAPWNLEGMLERMNAEVHARLQLGPGARVLDLGCGVGATARAVARLSPDAEVTGVTLVPWQIATARALTHAAGLDARVRFVQADYCALPYADASVDAVYAVESSCYATGAAKADFLREAARVLKPGGRLVVADGFRTGAPMNALVRRCYEAMCRFWRVDECATVGPFLDAARAAGLAAGVEDVSWRVAPPMAFVPLVTARFLWRECRRPGGLTRTRLENALAPLLGIVVGAARRAFHYCLVTARKA